MPISDSDPPDAGLTLRLRTEDLVQALANSNPGAAIAVIERTGRIVTAISNAVLNDVDAVRRVAGLDDAATSEAIRDLASSLHGIFEDGTRAGPPREPERLRGAGLGEVVGREVGMARLAVHASPSSLEDWAGPVVDADTLIAAGLSLGVLDAWKRARAIVELADRDRRAVYPSRQFEDRRPIPGLAEVQAVVGDPRSAWLWLVEPGDDGAPSWLDLLRRGAVSDVLEAARQDFR